MLYEPDGRRVGRKEGREGDREGGNEGQMDRWVADDGWRDGRKGGWTVTERSRGEVCSKRARGVQPKTNPESHKERLTGPQPEPRDWFLPRTPPPRLQPHLPAWYPPSGFPRT